MENCSLALRLPARGGSAADGAMEVAHDVGPTAIDVWSLAVNAKVDLLKLSYNELPRRIAKVGQFTARYNATEQLPGFACESGTYHAFLFACPEGARKEDCWVDVTSTKEDLVGECHACIASSFVLPLCVLRQNCRSFYGTTSDDLVRPVTYCSARERANLNFFLQFDHRR
jgi:hypothetical protein